MRIKKKLNRGINYIFKTSLSEKTPVLPIIHSDAIIDPRAKPSLDFASCSIFIESIEELYFTTC